MTKGYVSETSEELSWEEMEPRSIDAPIQKEVEYVELKLEHPNVDPVGMNGDFPSGVPYTYRSEERIFFWREFSHGCRSSLRDSDYVYTTPYELDSFHESVSPKLVDISGSEGEVVVDGTVAGVSKTAPVSDYPEPDVSLTVPKEGQEIGIEVSDPSKRRLSVPKHGRENIELSKERVRLGGKDGTETVLSPELVVRYPGRRTLYYPGSDYFLFPSFGLNLYNLPNPLEIPMRSGSPDHSRLAEETGGLNERPYTEEVLWQAFVYTVVNPTRETSPKIGQFENGLIVARV